MKNSLYDALISKNNIEWLQRRTDSLKSLIENAQLVCTSDEILYCVKDLQNLHCLQIHRDQVRPQQGMVEYSEKPGKPTFQIYSNQLKFLRS